GAEGAAVPVFWDLAARFGGFRRAVRGAAGALPAGVLPAPRRGGMFGAGAVLPAAESGGAHLFLPVSFWREHPACGGGVELLGRAGPPCAAGGCGRSDARGRRRACGVAEADAALCPAVFRAVPRCELGRRAG